MEQYTVAIVGTGPDPRNPTVEGFAMGYRHAEAYRNNENCRLVACADVVPENASVFAETFDLGEDGIYEEYEKMLAEVEPDDERERRDDYPDRHQPHQVHQQS